MVLQGGLSNVTSMFLYLVDTFVTPLPKTSGGAAAAIKPPVETPALGCLHPLHDGYFSSPADYMKWWVHVAYTMCSTVSALPGFIYPLGRKGTEP